ncbi:hypothetical protein AGMMS49983_21450 [Clostridia bacterium]|nr:hypothetical protein AGMMS49983_21450 [Clostridia bacterium]
MQFMKAVILSREDLKQYFHEGDDVSRTALIEIVDVDNRETLPFPADLRRIRLAFDDVFEPEMPNAMTTEQAAEVVLFFNSVKDSIDTLVVSCHAGIARSSAIAAAVLFSMGEDDWSIWEDYKYRPNAYCWGLMLEAFGADTSQAMDKVSHNRELISILYRMTGQTVWGGPNDAKKE